MELQIFPYQSIGSMYLNMELDEIKSSIAPNLIDVEKNLGYVFDSTIQIEFENNKSAFIGTIYPNVALYRGINLLEKTFAEILEIFKSDSKIYMEPGNSLIFLDTGLCFYSDDMESDTNPQQVGIFIEGYFDDSLHEFVKWNGSNLD